MKQTVIFGSLAYDEFLYTNADIVDEIGKDAKHALTILPLQKIERRFGGNGGNIALGMALLKERPALFSALGYDGDRYLDRLREKELCLSGIEIFDDIPSMTVYFIIDQFRKEVALFINEASKRRSFQADVLPEDIGLMHVGPCSPLLAKQALQHASINGIASIFDPGQDVYGFDVEDLEECMQRSSYTILNAQESAFVSSKISKDMAHRTFRIITRGKEGVSLEYRADIELVAACPLANAPDQTVGAGDAFRAGLLTGLSREEELHDAVCLGCGMASLTLASGKAQMDSLNIELLQSLLLQAYGKTCDSIV